MERLLFLLHGDSYEQVRPCLQEAVRTASVPDRLSIGATLSAPPDEQEAAEAEAAGWQLLISDDTRVYRAFPEFWQGETYVLLGDPGICFTPSWDRQLQYYLRETGEKTLMTGVLPWGGSTVDAVCPVAGESLTEDLTLNLTAGVPLRYAVEAHKGAFLNPAFLFGQAAFFQLAAVTDLPLFLEAYRERWQIMTLRTPVLRMQYATHLPRVSLADCPDPEILSDFARHFGIDMENRKLSPEIREGIFTSDLQVRGKVPFTVKVQEGVRRSLVGKGADPLCVTAYLEEDVRPDGQAMARFRRACNLENMPLLCFSSPSALRSILFSHPNTLAYKPRNGLVLDHVPDNPENRRRLEVLNRFFVLAQGMEKFMGHSHYIWMDFDYLRYPVYTGAAMQWNVICTEKVCMASVDGHPDFSMMVVPDVMVTPLCREIRAMCDHELRQTGMLPEPERVIQTLAEVPGRFDLIPTPSDHELLSLTMTLNGEEWGRKTMRMIFGKNRDGRMEDGETEDMPQTESDGAEEETEDT